MIPLLRYDIDISILTCPKQKYCFSLSSPWNPSLPQSLPFQKAPEIVYGFCLIIFFSLLPIPNAIVSQSNSIYNIYLRFICSCLIPLSSLSSKLPSLSWNNATVPKQMFIFYPCCHIIQAPQSNQNKHLKPNFWTLNSFQVGTTPFLPGPLFL